jgi:hypothetical protein
MNCESAIAKMLREELNLRGVQFREWKIVTAKTLKTNLVHLVTEQRGGREAG